MVRVTVSPTVNSPVTLPVNVTSVPASAAFTMLSAVTASMLSVAVGAVVSTLIGLLACVAGLPALSLTSAVTDTEPVVGSSPTASAGTVTLQALSVTVAV